MRRENCNSDSGRTWGHRLTQAHRSIGSIRHFEPEICEVVLIDDGPAGRRIPDLVHFRVTCLPNPRRGAGTGYLGRLWTGLVCGWSWIKKTLPDACVLKLDLDALVIGSFASRLTSEFARHPNAGIIGCVGATSNRDDVRFQACLHEKSGLRIVADCVLQIESQLDAIRKPNSHSTALVFLDHAQPTIGVAGPIPKPAQCLSDIWINGQLLPAVTGGAGFIGSHLVDRLARDPRVSTSEISRPYREWPRNATE